MKNKIINIIKKKKRYYIKIYKLLWRYNRKKDIYIKLIYKTKKNYFMD